MPESPRRTRPAHLALFALLAVALLLNLVPIWWGLPSYQGWAYDEIGPNELESPNAWPAKYPPLHRQVLRLALAPLDTLDALGVVSLDPLARYSLAFLILRLASVLMATATVYVVYRSARTLWSRWPAVGAAAAVAFMPPLVYYAKTANLEAPYLFWFGLSLFFFLRALRKRRLRDFVSFGAAAALSIASKDQAYGLYLLTPFPLVAALWSERGWRALTDRRVWLTGLGVAAVLALAYGLYMGPAELRRHVAAATAPSTFNVVTATPEGQIARLALAAQQVAFALSLPLALLAAGGAFVTFRRRRRESVALAFMIVGYYVGFILLLPYQTVRYLLPVAIIGSLFAGGALEAAGSSGRRRLPLALGAGAVFALALLRGVWVDRAMLSDSRYHVERWLAEASPEEPGLGLGRQHMMPRGVVATSFLRVWGEGCEFLDDRQPRHLVVNLADVRDERESEVVRRLAGGEYNYQEVLRYRSAVRPGLWGVERLLSNLDKVNPEVVVFARADRICLDERTLPAALAELRESNRPELRAHLTDYMLGHGAAAGFGLAGDAGAVAFGVQFGGWTRGTVPAAVLVTNELEQRAVPVLRLGCLAPAELLPVTVSIDDGRERREFIFTRRGRIEAGARALAPGASRLLLVWSDRAWQRPPDERWLGVSLSEVRLRPRPPRRPAGAERADPGR